MEEELENEREKLIFLNIRMDSKCNKLIKKLIGKYDIHLGYNEAMPTNRPADFLKLLNIKDDETIVVYVFQKNITIFIGFIRLIKNTENLYISEVVRTSYDDKHKGAMKEVLYAIICIAIKLGTPIEFEAKPSFGNSVGHKSTNPAKLYSYYNKMFTRKKNLENPYAKSIKYETMPNTLKNVINKLNNANENAPTCSGWFCGRGTRKRKS